VSLSVINEVTADAVFASRLLPVKGKRASKRLAFSPSKYPGKREENTDMPLPASLYTNGSLSIAPRKLKTTILDTHAAAAASRSAEAHIKQTVERANRVLDKLEAKSARIAAEIKRLQKLKAATEARHEAIEDRCILEIQATGLTKVAGIRSEMSIRPAAPSLVVDDESLIPAEYIVEKIETNPDKVAIKAALARGLDIEGVHLQQKTSLIRK
jgi:Gp157 protein